MSISLTDSERDELRGCAERYGLSLSAFLRLAAKEYVDRHAGVRLDSENQEG